MLRLARWVFFLALTFALSFFVLQDFTSLSPSSPRVAYQAGPSLRGTANIFSSCIWTIWLSVYTALHLNIDSRRRWRRRFFTKLQWTLIAMIAPELMLWTALGQLEMARKVRNPHDGHNSDEDSGQVGVEPGIDAPVLSPLVTSALTFRTQIWAWGCREV
jgi:hypothetical protein